MRRPWTIFATACFVWMLPTAAPADEPDLSGVEIGWCHPPAPECAPFDDLGWEGEYRSQRVELPSARPGAVLRGTLFAPPADVARPGRSPAIVIVPGSGGTAREENYHWSARDRAGHSLGAGSAAIAQERDERIGAIVAWDGLNGEQWSTDQNGFQHHLVAGHVPVPRATEHWLTPRVPALGLHSGHPTLKPYDTNPDIRSYAYRPWRDAGLPVMTLTRTASNRLLAEEVGGLDRETLLSETYTSKAYLPSRGVECEDFRTCDLPTPVRGRP